MADQRIEWNRETLDTLDRALTAIRTELKHGSPPAATFRDLVRGIGLVGRMFTILDNEARLHDGLEDDLVACCSALYMGRQGDAPGDAYKAASNAQKRVQLIRLGYARMETPAGGAR